METVNKLQRIPFYKVFTKKPDGSLTPIRVISVNGITIGPGVAFGKGVNFGGVDFFLYEQFDIAAEEVNGTLIIKGFYNR